ncbi:8473_t:CDS:1, partial [Paraglomus brasilianum]
MRQDGNFRRLEYAAPTSKQRRKYNLKKNIRIKRNGCFSNTYESITQNGSVGATLLRNLGRIQKRVLGKGSLNLIRNEEYISDLINNT